MDQSILYVDIENLTDIAKQALTLALNNWPDGFPKPNIIKLYGRADQMGLWEIWADRQMPGSEIVLRGVQHYTADGSKNSADIALALEALTDVMKGNAKYVSLLSDDSDFATLFSVLKQESAVTDGSNVPFAWFMTDRKNTRSSVLSEFFPPEYIHIVACSPKSAGAPETTKRKPSPKSRGDDVDDIARFIIQNIKVGPFRSADCKKLITKNRPESALAKLDSAPFGTKFAETIYPVLERYGVKSQKSSKGPRKYEMTEEAKKLQPHTQ